jgi:hypothetical protein
MPLLDLLIDDCAQCSRIASHVAKSGRFPQFQSTTCCK